jgi:serine protease AprX
MKRILALLIWIVPAILAADPQFSKLERIYDADGDRIFENLKDRMIRSKPDELIPVIVLYKEQTPTAGTFGARLNQIRSGQVKYVYHNLPAVSVRMTSKQIEEAKKNDSWIEQIELDSRVRAAMNTARPSFGVDDIKTQFGFTGDGDQIKGNYSKNDIVIAVIDSGVNANHPDLRGKVLFWKDFVKNRAVPYDDNGHGTMVSGVALGTGKLKKKFVGVAPEAALVAMKVLDSGGSGDISDAIAAIDLAIDLKKDLNIRIINMSLAVPGSSAGHDAFSQVANRAVLNGIVVVGAAGNDGPSSKTIGSPAAAANIITVGAGADTGERGFFLAGFSSRGPTADGRIKPDLWAPGYRIQSTSKAGGYATLSGTSFAAPFVSGVVALMLQANPSLKPSTVKSILIKTAEKWAPGGKSNEAGSGRLRAYDAIFRASALTTNPNPPDGPTVFFVKNSINAGEVQNYSFFVYRVKNSIAITAILFDFPGQGLILELLDPAGNVVVRQNRFDRQESLTFKPSHAGDYTIRVTGSGGSTSFLLDVSADYSPVF